MKRKVGQLIIVGFVGTDSTSPGFRRLIHNLEHGIVGGVLFLPRNIVGRPELEKMVLEIKQCSSSTVPFIAIDEEGGTVDWLGEEYGFERIPSAAKVAQSGDENARRQYNALARKLRNVGFNMNLAPVVDLNTNPHNPIIGTRERSFSSDTTLVERYAKIFIEEHRALGILTVLKHFPGHGSSATDTHAAAADVGSSWSPEELAPYRGLIAAGLVDAVMVGHLVNSQRWGGVATQRGSTAISGLLRRDLQFDGVVISDDLTMDAVRGGANAFSEVVRSAIGAGIDLVLIVHPVTGETADSALAINTALVEGVQSGQIARDSIERSWQRVTNLRARA